MEVGVDLRTLTVDSFLPFLGQEFEISVEENSEPFTKFVLVEAAQKGSLPEPFRQPFHLLFNGPADLPLGQQTLWFTNADFGKAPIFVVPVAGDAEKRQYQSIFN